MYKHLGFLFLRAILLSGCKKYPDGPLLSLQTKKHRVVGQWEVDYFGVNGNDSTAYLKSQSFYGRYGFLKEERGSSNKLIFLVSNETGTNAKGWWEFADDKELIRIYIYDYYGAGNVGPYRAPDQEWSIQRLKEKELWLKCNYNNKEYLVKFNLVKNNV